MGSECKAIIAKDWNHNFRVISIEMKSKTEIIIGITGQAGTYLANLLFSKCYSVYGGYRRTVLTRSLTYRKVWH
jgi:hypothetical protein